MKASFTRNRSIRDTKAKAGNDNAPRIDEIVEMFQPKKNVWYQIRLLGPSFSYGMHWFEVYSEKKKGNASFSKQCLAYDDEAESVDSTIACPYCQLDEKGRPAVHYYQNAIIRKLAEKTPKNFTDDYSKDESKTGFKDGKESDAWTPVRVIRLPPGSVQDLRSLSELNKHGKGKNVEAYDLSDPEYGCDLNYMFDPEAEGRSKHKFQKGDGSPLTEEEQEYLLWNIENMIQPEDLNSADKEAISIAERTEVEYESMVGSSKSGSGYKKPAGGKKGGKDDDDGDDEDFEEGQRVVITDDDGDEYTGVIDEINTKKVVITDDNDDQHTFKLADVEIAAAPEAKKKKAAGKDEGDEDDFEEGQEVVVTDEDGDDYTGTITEITAKKIVVEDEDGDVHTFKRADVEITAKPAKKAAGKKPAAKDDADDEDELAEGATVIVTDEDGDDHEGAITEINAKKVVIEDEDGDTHAFKRADVEIKVKPAKKAGSKKPAAGKDEAEDADEDDFEEGQEVVVTDEDGDDYEGTITEITAKKIVIEDEDGDTHPFKRADVEIKAKKKAKKPAGKKPSKSDDDDDTPPAGKKAAGGRKRPSFDDE